MSNSSSSIIGKKRKLQHRYEPSTPLEMRDFEDNSLVYLLRIIKQNYGSNYMSLPFT